MSAVPLPGTALFRVQRVESAPAYPQIKAAWLPRTSVLPLGSDLEALDDGAEEAGVVAEELVLDFERERDDAVRVGPGEGVRFVCEDGLEDGVVGRAEGVLVEEDPAPAPVAAGAGGVGRHGVTSVRAGDMYARSRHTVNGGGGLDLERGPE